MSWKLFTQILLLMIAGTLLLGSLKIGLWKCHRASMEKRAETMMEKGRRGSRK